MFTGIITDLGEVRAIVPEADARFEFTTHFDTATLDMGASVCCSGVCLTVIDTGPGWFAATVSAETLAITTLSNWSIGKAVNLERALRLGDELGGHLVSGHVDGLGEFIATTEEGKSARLEFAAPDGLKRFIAAKGSITVDGVSLTVNSVENRCFGINVIPHTQAETTLGRLRPGDAVNLEIDLLARYAARIIESNG